LILTEGTTLEFAFWLELLLFMLLLGLSGFFSSSETSLFSLSQVQLEQMRNEGHPRIGLIERLLSEPRRLIVTILIGNEFVNVAASVISAVMVIELLGADNKLVNLFIMVPILLVFGEITPKTLAIRNNRAFASFQSGPIDLFARAISPLRWLVRQVAEWFITLVVGRERSRGNLITEDMVRTLAHEAVGEGALDRMEAQFIDHIFEFGNRTLEEVMTPRSDIQFLSDEMFLPEILGAIQEARHSRLPVYHEHRDNVLGILHVRDLLGVDLEALAARPDGIAELLRESSFFPESKPAVELFDTFRKRKLSFALTVDEYGGVTGLVTMEDLLECVFGEIRSPSDGHPMEYFRDLGEGRYSVDTAMPIEDFNRQFSASFDDQQAETLGGILLNAFGELPQEGATIELMPFRFDVEQVENNRINRVRMEALPAALEVAELPRPEAGPEPEQKQPGGTDEKPREG
jgi:putative hemolysin